MLDRVSRREPSTRKSLLGGLLLGTLAVGLLALPIGMLLDAPSDLFSFAMLLAIPAMLTLVLVTGGIGIYLYDLDDLALRICAWTMLGFGLFTVILGGGLLYYAPAHLVRVPGPVLLVNVAGGGAVLGFLIGLYDAQQHLLYRDLNDEYERALGLSQRLSVLARILRHDLRNHLNIILGHSASLHRRVDSREGEVAAAAIQQSSRELVDISETIDQFSTILSSPELGDTNVRVDLLSTVEDAIETMVTQHDVSREAFSVSGPATATVSASPLLPKAIEELVENAVVHCEADEPSIQIEIEDHDDSGLLELRVIDSGPGIPERERAVLEKDIETQLTHSLGVGLWLVRWVVSSSGGDLSFEARDPAGTIARVRIPR